MDPVRIGAPASRPASARPSAPASPARLVSSGPNRASPCRIQRKLGRTGSRSSVTPTGPIPSSRLKRRLFPGSSFSVASTHAVPMVGCPAKGTSRAGVKIRTRAAQSGRVGGRRNVVSEQFISRAMACISPSSRLFASKTTASGFPPKTRSVNTSTWTNRCSLVNLALPLTLPSPLSGERES